MAYHSGRRLPQASSRATARATGSRSVATSGVALRLRLAGVVAWATGHVWLRGQRPIASRRIRPRHRAFKNRSALQWPNWFDKLVTHTRRFVLTLDSLQVLINYDTFKTT